MNTFYAALTVCLFGLMVVGFVLTIPVYVEVVEAQYSTSAHHRETLVAVNR